MATLYEIDDAIERLVQKGVDEETGEISQSAVLEMDQLQMEREQKIDNIMAYVKNLTSDAKAFEEEEKRLAALRKRASQKAEWLKRYLSQHMEAGTETFTSSRGKITWRKSEKVIANIDEIPEHYRVSQTTVRPDLTAIKKAIKGGETIPGARIEVFQNIQIK